MYLVSQKFFNVIDLTFQESNVSSWNQMIQEVEHLVFPISASMRSRAEKNNLL